MDPSAIIFLIFTVIAAAMLIAVPVKILCIIYKWLSKKGYKFIGILLMIVCVFYTAYSVYTAIYPTDNFFFKEFKTVTLQEVPKSAKILRKKASYPDFHGDYGSVSLIKLSFSDYESLLKSLKNDNRFNKNGELISSAELNSVMEGYKTNRTLHSFTRSIPNEEDHYLYIGFLDDRRTILVIIYVT